MFRQGSKLNKKLAFFPDYRVQWQAFNLINNGNMWGRFWCSLQLKKEDHFDPVFRWELKKVFRHQEKKVPKSESYFLNWESSLWTSKYLISKVLVWFWLIFLTIEIAHTSIWFMQIFLSPHFRSKSLKFLKCIWRNPSLISLVCNLL